MIAIWDPQIALISIAVFAAGVSFSMFIAAPYRQRNDARGAIDDMELKMAQLGKQGARLSAEINYVNFGDVGDGQTPVVSVFATIMNAGNTASVARNFSITLVTGDEKFLCDPILVEQDWTFVMSEGTQTLSPEDQLTRKAATPIAQGGMTQGVLHCMCPVEFKAKVVGQADYSIELGFFNVAGERIASKIEFGNNDVKVDKLLPPIETVRMKYDKPEASSENQD